MPPTFRRSTSPNTMFRSETCVPAEVANHPPPPRMYPRSKHFPTKTVCFRAFGGTLFREPPESSCFRSCESRPRTHPESREFQMLAPDRCNSGSVPTFHPIEGTRSSDSSEGVPRAAPATRVTVREPVREPLRESAFEETASPRRPEACWKPIVEPRRFDRGSRMHREAQSVHQKSMMRSR